MAGIPTPYSGKNVIKSTGWPYAIITGREITSIFEKYSSSFAELSSSKFTSNKSMHHIVHHLCDI